MRHVLQHHGACRDARAVADLDIAQHLGPCPNHHAVADFRVAVAVLFAGAAKGDRMQHRDVIAHHRRLTDHDGMGVVDHDAATDAGSGMDIDAEHFRDAHLHEIGHVAAALLPEPMADPVGLHRLITLEEQDRLDEAQAGRVTVEHGRDIGAGGLAQIGVRGIGFIRDFAQDLFQIICLGFLKNNLNLWSIIASWLLDIFKKGFYKNELIKSTYSFFEIPQKPLYFW